MSNLEPERISIREATLLLQCSKERLEFYLNKKLLTAYVRIPRCLPAIPSYGNTLDNEIYGPLALGYLFNQQLDDLCQIKPPISWQDNGRVECNTIIVSTMTGSPPTASDLQISASDVRVESDGRIFSRIPWRFSEKDIKLTTEDVKQIAAETKRASEESGETPLMGMKAIADHLGVSVSSIKQYKKDRFFPCHNQCGKKIAYASELNAWRDKKKK